MHSAQVRLPFNPANNRTGPVTSAVAVFTLTIFGNQTANGVAALSNIGVSQQLWGAAAQHAATCRRPLIHLLTWRLLPAQGAYAAHIHFGEMRRHIALRQA